jgi:regulator of replication initiation timing
MTGGNKSVIDEIGSLRNEIKELSFENSNLRKGMREYQEMVNEWKQKEVEDHVKEGKMEEKKGEE